MIITCMQSFDVAYTDRDGKVKKAVLRPGSRNYPMLNHKDPVVAEQLRVLRKHHRIAFDEILPDPVETKVVDLLEKSAVKKNDRGNKKNKKKVKEITEKRDPDKSGGKVPE